MEQKYSRMRESVKEKIKLKDRRERETYRWEWYKGELYYGKYILLTSRYMASTEKQ